MTREQAERSAVEADSRDGSWSPITDGVSDWVCICSSPVQRMGNAYAGRSTLDISLRYLKGMYLSNLPEVVAGTQVWATGPVSRWRPECGRQGSPRYGASLQDVVYSSDSGFRRYIVVG